MATSRLRIGSQAVPSSFRCAVQQKRKLKLLREVVNTATIGRLQQKLDRAFPRVSI
jgi:hypothetical protein